MLVDNKSKIGQIIASDWKSGALRFDSDRGALYKEETQQEYLLTDRNNVARYDGVSQTLNLYDAQLKAFVPVNALRDGELLDRTRVLKRDDILAKPTWGQTAADVSLVVAQGVVSGAAIGAVGGAIHAAVEHAPRRLLHPSPAMPVVKVYDAGTNLLGNHSGNLRVSTAALSALSPGELTPPTPPWPIVPPPPAPPPGAGRSVQEGVNEAAFGAIGGAIGGAAGIIGGPAGVVVGEAIGVVIGVGIGRLWNEIF